MRRFTNTGFGDPGGLIQGREGAFYGVTESGPGGPGSIYRITADGALYGTARRAGPARSGVVYRLTLPAIAP
jgi:hypothetical protein